MHIFAIFKKKLLLLGAIVKKYLKITVLSSGYVQTNERATNSHKRCSLTAFHVCDVTAI